jgi:hypothetical protein
MEGKKEEHEENSRRRDRDRDRDRLLGNENEAESAMLQTYNLTSVYNKTNNKQTNSMVCVRERTIPTERPPLVGEVIANFCG